MAYHPAPIDLSGVTVEGELLEDVERIARNVHETWAAARVEQGWVFGQTDDPGRKTHRCLVDYEDLTETERDVDRATVLATIKMLRYLGYETKKE